MRWRLFLLFILSIPTAMMAQKPVSFPSEYIDFTIDNECFTINGIYTFRNNTGTTIFHDILFPFVNEVSQIDTISIVDLRNFQRVPFKKLKKEVVFNLNIAPNDSTEINIFYKQKRTHKNVYILTSAQSWGEPLEKAVYTLTIDKNLKIDSFSIEPDSAKTGDEYTTYFWSKFNFMPQTDFEITIAQ